MERDPQTGRFITGNKAAVGNKGNRKPKWKNRNAVKHGHRSKYNLCWITESGQLAIVFGEKCCVTSVVIFRKGGYFVLEDGSVRIKEGVWGHLFGGGSELILQTTNPPVKFE